MRGVRRPMPSDRGFSLVEVLLSVVILGVAGLAFIDGLQSNVLQVRRVDANASAAVALASAVENIKAAPYVSCATNRNPYASLPGGLAIPAGITVSVSEFVVGAATPWQPCATVQSAGSAQSIVLTASDGVSRTMMRFAATAPTASPNPTPTPTVPITATVTTDAKSACGTFSKSSSSKPCLITLTNTAGSGSTWRVTGMTFAGGSFLNPAPTASVSQSTAIVISTYTLDGGRSCPDKTSPAMSIALVDDGNATTTSVFPVITC